MMHPKINKWLFFFLMSSITLELSAQADSVAVTDTLDPIEKKEIRDGEFFGTTEFNGEIIPILIIDGDTLPTISAPDVFITQKRNFANRDERRRYHQWRRYAAKVYPYALEAVRLYRKIQEETEGMKKRKKKKFTKSKEKELKPQYEEELKALTKSQGYILIKMVERELEIPFYDVISTLRGGWTAVRWQTMASFYGYNLRRGYDPTEDEILEMILSDLSLTYEYDMYNTDWKDED